PIFSQPSRSSHGPPTTPPHPYGAQILLLVSPLEALPPKLFQSLFIGQVVPLPIAVFLAVRRPLCLGPHHRLVVRGTHDNAIFVGQLRIPRIIFIKRLAPQDRKSTRLNSSHVSISYAVFC